MSIGDVLGWSDLKVCTQVAVVGCGYWGKHYVRISSEQPRLVCKYACDFFPDNLDSIGKKYPSVIRTTKLEDILNDKEVEVVFVIVPARLHFEVVQKCLEARKHVLVEKPYTTVTADCEALTKLGCSVGRQICVGHTYLYNSYVRWLWTTLVDKKSLGKIHTLYARRTNFGPVRQDVDAMWDLAPHDISVFQYIIGDMPISVSAIGQNIVSDNGLSDVVFMTLKYPNGVIAHVHVSWLDPHKVRNLVIVGSDGRAVMDEMNQEEPIKVYNKGYRPRDEEKEPARGGVIFRDGDIMAPAVPAKEPLTEQVLDFMGGVQQGKSPLCTAEFATDVVRILEAASQSILQEGAPVRF